MATVTHTRQAKQADNLLNMLEYLPINRNLRNNPIARGERSSVKWMRNKAKGYRRYRIPNAEIRLPLDCGFKRHATGFDVAMLLTLTGLCISRGPGELSISNSDIVRHMGITQSGYHRNKVAAALEFWRHATIIFERWYTPDRAAEQKADKYDSLRIERPIAEVERGRVVLNRDWLKLATKYYQQVPTPLPVEAPVQNLCLLVLGWRRTDKAVASGKLQRKRFRSAREITMRIGLDHRERNLQLPLIAAKLAWWFEDRGGMFKMIERDDGIVLKYRLPVPKVPERIARKRAKAIKSFLARRREHAD